MRNILVTGILFSSVLLHAQSVTKGSSINVETRNEIASASPAPGSPKPLSSSNAVSKPYRISTGVVWPQMISGPAVKVSAADFPGQQLAAEHMIVSFQVDANGKPQNVHLLKSVNPVVNERVLASVRQYRFRPATLDDQTVPVDVNMHISFEAK